MSFGAEPTTINFENGLTLWSGANGQGKSSALLDTLSYCLYGKPYRKIKIEELINRKNKNGLKTKCVFAIGDDIYSLLRTKSPDKLELKKNDVDQDLLSSKKLTQQEIDKILGVSYEIFKQTISIAVSYNKPFLILDAKEKRKTIEQMFGLSEFTKMNKVLSEKNKASKRAFDMLGINISNIESTISLFKKQIVDLEEQNKNFERLNKEKIDNAQASLSKEQADLCKSMIDSKPIYEQEIKLQTKIKSLDKNKYTTAKSKLEKQKNDLSWNIKSFSTQIRKLENEKECPVCKKPFDEVSRLKEIQDLSLQKHSSEASLKDIDGKIILLSENIEIIEGKETELVLVQNKIREHKQEIKDKERTIKYLRDQIAELQGAKNEIDIDKVRKQVVGKEAELLSSQTQKAIEETNVRNFAIVDKVLSDEGARSYIIDKIIPVINKKINEYLEMFEVPIRITFDKYMEEKIVSLEHFRQEVSYWSFSEGEKKRIDFSIMIALVETMKIVSNWCSNILILDEIADTSLDNSGFEMILETLKTLANTKQMNINIISHKVDETHKNFFNKCYNISKNSNGFSIIESPNV